MEWNYKMRVGFQLSMQTSDLTCFSWRRVEEYSAVQKYKHTSKMAVSDNHVPTSHGLK